MPDTDQSIDVRMLTRVAALAPEEWDACACPETFDGGRPEDPFTTHRFLHALEASGSVGAGTGWQVHHLLAERGGAPIGAMPLYAKTHSQGEYIFDHAFANAWQRAGGRYYPKLQSAVPFTPATGRRLLARPGDTDLAQRALLQGMVQIASDSRLSSAHVTFCTAQEAELGAEMGFLHRVTQQFHWQNNGYSSFDDFLSDLSSRKRKAIRKERATAQAFGGDIVALTGDAIEPGHWDAFWSFYQDTGARKWGTPYLTRRFFDIAHETIRHDMLLVLALRAGRPVAGALNFIGRGTLFGRYWGCIEDHPCMHFELCYYQAIDWAIAQGLPRVEAGAQGEHKLARGYMPSAVHSLHWFADAGFRDAVARYIRQERDAVGQEMEFLADYGPFRKTDGSNRA